MFSVLGTPQLHGQMLMGGESCRAQWRGRAKREGKMFAKVLAGTLMDILAAALCDVVVGAPLAVTRAVKAEFGRRLQASCSE